MNEKTGSHLLRTFALFQISGIIFLILFFYFNKTDKVLENALLLAVLNTIFLSIIPFTIFIISFYSYRKTGIRNELYIGFGMFFFGISSFMAGWILYLQGSQNMLVTFHNTGALLASILNFIGSIFSIRGFRYDNRKNIKVVKMIFPVVSIIFFFILLYIGCKFNLTPVFFIQDKGPTLLRQAVLISAALLFLSSAIVFYIIYEKLNNKFFYWYALGLILISLGLFAVLLQKNIGGPIGWLGRISQYTGSFYLLISVIITIKESFIKGISIEKNKFFFYKKINYNFNTLIETINQAIIVIDEDLMIFLWNANAEKIFGYKKNEVLGTSILNFIRNQENAKNNFQQIISESMNKINETFSENIFEMDLLNKNGNKFTGEISFSHPDKSDMKFLTVMIRDITKRKPAQLELLKHKENLEKTIEEKTKDLNLINQDLLELIKTKEFLIKEVHHRVKNNLNMIASLVSLQTYKTKEKDFIQILESIRTKILAISVIHEKLYKSQDLIHIDFEEYIVSIITSILSISQFTKNIDLFFDVENIKLEINTSISIGLIITELVTNAIKYGFQSDVKGYIKISLNKKDEEYILIVENSGKSFPKNIDFRNIDSLGMQMVCNFVMLLNGTIELEKEPVTKFIITSKLEQK